MCNLELGVPKIGSQGVKNIVWGNNGWNVLNFMKNINPQIQEVQQTPSTKAWIKQHGGTSESNCLKDSDKDKINSSWEKKTLLQRDKSKMTEDFLSETKQTTRQ